MIAAGTGAEVTGLDISADQLEKARAAAAEAGLEIRFDEGDAQALPYEAASFEVVVSAFGMIFAPDHQRAAGELTRVSKPGARVAITSWPVDDWYLVNARVRPDYETTGTKRWAEEDHVRSLFPNLELTFGRGPTATRADSSDALWELLSTSVPGLKAYLDGLDDNARLAVRAEFEPLLADGELRREYVLIHGRKR